jgi:hypothetical protein
METGAIAQSLAQHGFHFDPMHPGMMLYTGPNEFVTPGDAAAISGALSDFGKSAAYLSSANPIAFAAKPGTYAMSQPNPRYEGGPPIAPLAAALDRSVRLFQVRETTLPDLKTLLDRVVGWRGVGEVNMSGGISWSNFQRLDRVTSRIRPGGYQSTCDARLAIVRTIAGPAGTIEDFVRDSVAGDFVAQVHHLDPGGANRWTLWRLPVTGDARPTLLLASILFPKITFGNGALYFERDDRELLRWPARARKPAKINSEAGFRELAQSYDGRSILALDADSVYDKGGDRLLRFQGARSEIVVTAELTQAKCLVEFAPAQFAWLDQGRRGMVQFLTSSNEPPRDLQAADEELDALCWDGSHFFSLGTNRHRLYRFSIDGQIEGAWLQDEADNPLMTSSRGSAVLRAYPNELWLASENQLLQLDPKKLEWSRNDDK